MTAPAGATLVIGPGAPVVRRAVGPTAWACLEVIMTSATPAGDTAAAAVSIRSLASELDVSKNTAARAVAALRRAGLVRPAQRRSSSGAFLRGHYELRVSADVLAIAPRDRTVRRAGTARLTVEQLALLPE